MLAFESQLERDFYTILEFDPVVRTVAEQPVRISYLGDKGEQRHYTPDCLIEYTLASQLRPMLVEVKHRTDLFAQWKILRPKLRAATKFARDRGWVFRIITDREINEIHVRNARWLLGYRTLLIPDIEEYESRLLHAFKDSQYVITPGKLVGSLGATSTEQCILLATLWNFVANGKASYNLDEKLSMSTQIRVVQS